MRRCWLIGLALLLCGCGLASYEERMVRTQQTVQRFEDEGRTLDEPIQIPKRVEKDGSAFLVANAFLRPPKGISPFVSNEKEPRGGKLYTYRPRAEKAARPFGFVEVAFGGAEKEFAAEVLKILGAPATTQMRTHSVTVAGRPVTLESVEIDADPTVYSIHVVKGGNSQMAVVFWIEKANRASAGRTLNLCLESMGLDTDAARLREQLSRGSPLTKVAARKDEG